MLLGLDKCRNECTMESSFVRRRYHIKEFVVEYTGFALSEEKLIHFYDKWSYELEKSEDNKYNSFDDLFHF